MASAVIEEEIEAAPEILEESINNDDQEALVVEAQPPAKWYHVFRRRPNIDKEPDENPDGTLNTMNGVVIPVCLSMFSSLVFLRVGYIVGNSGLYVSLAQLVGAYLILICTVTSISAIATNGSVKSGGVYFMLSRTLGPQLGGTVGVLFYAANVVSGALYASGFSETLEANFGPKGRLIPDAISCTTWTKIGYSSAVLTTCLLISLVGAKAFSKCTIIFAFLLLVAMSDLGISFISENTFTESYNETLHKNCTVNCTYVVTNGSFYGLFYDHGEHWMALYKQNHAFDRMAQRDCSDRQAYISFITTFGVLFAGVTGIMAGANVSGDLKNPSKSIPYGTLGACGITFVTYSALFVATALTCEKSLLQHNCLYMMDFDISGGYIILGGALLVTFCACLNCLIGASKVVEALVSDTMFGEFANHWFGAIKIGNNPIIAIVITFIFMLTALFVGSLNRIAQLSSVFFLVSYLTVNCACFFLEWASAPNFRPSFKMYSLITSAFGAIGCFVMMIIISRIFAAVAGCMMLCGLIIFSFTTASKHKEWGSIGQALIFHQVRKYLLMMDVRKDHVKFWRPQILLLVSNPRYNCALIDFINALKKSGLYILGHVHVTDFDQLEGPDPSVSELGNYLSLIDHLKVKAFSEITVAPTLRQGVQQLARISGLGAMKPNTVILGFGHPEDERKDHLGDSEGQFFNQELHDAFHCGLDDDDELENNPPNNNDVRKIEIMNTVSDMLKLEKNVCLARNFHQIDKVDKKYVDVWLIDFFETPNPSVNDPGQSFMMQLGTILTMTRPWKNFRLRVIVRIMDEESRRNNVRQLQQTLKEMRIPAEVVTINFREPHTIVQNAGAVIVGEPNLDLMRIPDEFMQKTNQIIKDHSEETAVTFLRLPEPPGRQFDAQTLRMYKLLQIQSEQLPPVMYVRGIKTVVSSSL